MNIGVGLCAKYTGEREAFECVFGAHFGRSAVENKND